MQNIRYASRQIDFKIPENVTLAQQVFCGVLALMCTTYFIIYQLIERKKDQKTIWVPPKTPPSLPFGPQPEPPKPSDYTETSVYDHELRLLKEALGSLGMSGAIAMGMSLKFNIHASLVMQGIMLPVGLLDVGAFNKYILGRATKSDGSPWYGESEEQPVAQEVTDVGADDEDEAVPRVEELPEEDEDTKKRN